MPLDALSEHLRDAHAGRRPLRLRGGGSKDFLGGMLAGETLDISPCQGVVAYEPTELYLSARAGTPLAEIEALLAENGQMLAFEPPHFGPATLGGCIAAGLAGPRRMAAGSVRDYVLGVTLIDGRGQILRFGGQVMKNVAGYDVSRLIAGSMGTLGLIGEATVKVLPRPAAEQTLLFELDEATALARLNTWRPQPLPISASFWQDGCLHVRLSGADSAVNAASRQLGGSRQGEAGAAAFWADVREQRLAVFQGGALWRLALPATAPVLPEQGETGRCFEWGGSLRWLRAASTDSERLRAAVAALGGHATLFRASESARCLASAFTPLPPALLALHRRLKAVFDPAGILNPGRLYAEL